MFDTKTFEQIIYDIKNNLPKGIRYLSENLDKKIYILFKNQFNKLNLISREEFEIQKQILLNTREKIMQLEKKIEYLENLLSNDLNKIN